MRFTTKLSVPNGLHERELSDWLRTSRDVKDTLRDSIQLNRRQFVKRVAASSTVALGCGPGSYMFIPQRAEAQALSLIAAVITFLNVFIPAAQDLSKVLRPRRRIPGDEKLELVGGASPYGDNFFAVVDEDTLRADSAFAMSSLENPLKFILDRDGLNSPAFEGSANRPISAADFDLNGNSVVKLNELPIYAESEGTKSVWALTEPGDKKSNSFEVRNPS